MKTLIATVAGAGLLTAAAAVLADDGSAVRTHTLQVKERLQDIERIDVTAEKPANPDAEPLDEALRAILDEAERIEQEAHAVAAER